jgi:outer membrane protein TolC
VKRRRPPLPLFRPRTSVLLLSLAGCLLAAAPGAAEEPDAWQEQPGSATPSTTGTAAVTLDLGACLQLALHEHPRIAAARASLASAEDARSALDAMRTPECLAPDLPVRRRQAAVGVTAAAFGVQHAELEVSYDVVRTYVTVLYAREQERVARGVVARLSATQDLTRQALKAGARDVNASDVSRITVAVRLAETKHLEASQGIKRALAALREALGQGPEFHFGVPDQRLPVPEARPVLHDALAAALTRRPGLIQAQLFADLVALEVEAQGTTCRTRVETFAAGGDIHSRPVPTGTHDTVYRPGALGSEMPGLLAGSKAERMQRARDLHARALDVVAQTRNLITLETEDAYLRWEMAAQQVAKAREAADAAEKLAAELDRKLTTGLRVKPDDVVNAHAQAAQARAQYNQHLDEEIIALADLVRATAGGFHAGLVDALTLKQEQAPKEDNKGK